MFLLFAVLYLLALGWVAWRRRSLLLDVLAPGLLAVFTLAFFWRLVSGDVFMPADGGDLGSFLFPTYSFIQQSLRQGVWPLWNPHLFGGTPFVAEVQSGILYPPHLLRFWLGPGLRYADMQWLVLLHIWWAGTTTYLLGRGLKLGRWGALFAATAFMFSDLFIVHFGNLNLIAVASWLPLALWGVDRSLQQGGGGAWRWAAVAGLALGVGSLAGHPQMTLFSLMAAAMWVGLWLILSRNNGKPPWRRAVITLVITSGVTVGLMAPLLLPGFEFARLSERAEWRYAETVAYSLSPAQLIGLILPNFFGRGPALHWGLWPRVEAGYVGILTLLLAVLGVLLRRDRRSWLLVGLAALALAFSLGVYSIIHGWLTWLLPGLEQLRAPARFIFVFDLSLALLAGRGLQAMMEAWSEADRAAFAAFWRFCRTLLIILIAVAIPLIYAVLLLTQDAAAAQHLRASIVTIALMQFALFFVAGLALLYARYRGWIRPGLFAALAVALVLVDLASLGAYEDISSDEPTANFYRQALVDFLATDPDLYRLDARTDIDALWQPDTAQLHGLYDVWGVANPLTLGYYVDYWNAVGSRSTDLYALLNTKYVLGRKDVTLDWQVWELVFDGDPDLNLYRNRRFQPRAHLLGRATPVPDLAAARAAVRSPAFQPLAEAALEGGEAQNGPGGSATVASQRANDMRLMTDSSAPDVLLVSQTWYPGWEARIDGGAWQPVLRADGVWQAVQVPAGQHQVELRFRSRPFVVGLLVAAGVLLAMGGGWVGERARGRR
ncbi:MAG: YfhO family protein [Caldilineales bacterium]|nr:YfhO family protein [Caldilineales bacterium]